MKNKIWFITGVSSGIGHHLTKEAALLGYTVVGTVRKEAQIKEVDALVPGKTFGYVMDVNNHEQVKKVVNEVANKFGTIDVLVNNAGYGLMGSIEEITMQEARDQMETNFFGALAVTQAVLPIMRKQKSGHILHITSQAGILANTGLGLYNASKFALEGLGEALYREVAHLGIKVTLVEPGPFRTHWAGASMKFAKQEIEDYKASAGTVIKMIADINGKQPGDPIAGSHAIIKMVESENPPLRLALGQRAVDTIRRKADMLLKDAADWEAVSAATDYKDQ